MILTNSSLHNCQKGYASVNEKRMNMLIDFDGLTIIIGIVIYILICIFIHKKYKKEKIYYVFSTIMFCYFMCIAKLTLFPIVMIGLPANIKESINIIPFHNGINRTDILNLIMTIPLGIGIPFITKINNIKKILLLGLCFGLGIETIQYLETFLTKGFSHRIIDINDVIFNFTGTVIGFFVLYVFSRLFITTEFTSQGVKLKKTGKAPERLEEDFVDIPDLAQTFVVTCALLNIPFRFTGLQSLKIKETYRIAALRTELKKLGYVIEEENDSILMWNGERCEPEEIPVIDTYEDHRMAMAFAPAVICHPNLLIADPQVVTKSYPGYWEDLKQAGFQVINEG